MVGLLLLAPMTAVMGILVVNFRMAFFSDAISHSAFAGVAPAHLPVDGRPCRCSACWSAWGS